jgi:hypothetical protein
MPAQTSSVSAERTFSPLLPVVLWWSCWRLLSPLLSLTYKGVARTDFHDGSKAKYHRDKNIHNYQHLPAMFMWTPGFQGVHLSNKVGPFRIQGENPINHTGWSGKFLWLSACCVCDAEKQQLCLLPHIVNSSESCKYPVVIRKITHSSMIFPLNCPCWSKIVQLAIFDDTGWAPEQV